MLPTEQNSIILDLLFDLATWHAYAKLRLHTDTMLKYFDTMTSNIRHSLRIFDGEVCSKYVTQELPQEEVARGRRAVQLMKVNVVAGRSVTTAAAPVVKGPKRRYFNLSTYKLHVLGDYPNQIRRFGTTDSFSTQPVSLICPHFSSVYLKHASGRITAQERQTTI